jgi:hypothetical protein
MKKGRYSVLILVSFLLAAILVSPALAKKKHKVKAPPKYLTFDVSLGITYDDNIIRYSEADLDLFSADTIPSKFSIETKNDWILTPQIRARLQNKLFGNQSSSVTIGYDYFGYIRNDIRRYSRFSIEARQGFHSKGYVQLTYGYVPKYYYRNLFYLHDPLGGDLYMPANFAKNSFQAEIGYDFTRTFKADIGYQFVDKSYNHEFTYRNLTLNGFNTNGIWRPVKILKIWGGYDYENANANGANMPDTVLDVSYDSWGFTLGVRHYATFLPKLKAELYTTFQFQYVLYQSNKLPDIRGRHTFQYGRTDNNFITHFGIACQIPYQLHLEADYGLFIKKASLPDIYPNLYIRIPQTTAELEKKLNYNANAVTLRVSRQF